MPESLDYADLDLDRTRRRGYPEAVYCAGKTAAQVGGIAAAVRARPDVITLFTRASPEHAAAVLAELPDAHHDADAGLLAWPPAPPAPSGGLVVVVAAGTSDLRAAQEAELTARYLGRATELVVDVGVAGLHRILGRLELLRRARVVVVAAGMDGALPSVVAGLVPAPVVALPTSVGYGAAFGGLAPLLGMLNACSPGVAVVNIDNGYGAGHLAAQIAAGADLESVPAGPQPERHAWIDASAGVAGDMLLGALLDAGAAISEVQAAIDSVIPGAIRIGFSEVTRAGLRAGRAHVEVLADQPPHRTWRDLQALLTTADLAEPVRDQAIAVFARLATAEARVHGIEVGDVHFHEVGALDAIADIVGVCAALHDLGISTVSAGAVAVGSGHVRTAHGRLPVPVPAVAELALGWRILSGGPGELATPTGMALVRTLATVCEDVPPMSPEAVGVGAGGRERADRANVVRMMIGLTDDAGPRPARLRTTGDAGAEAAVLLEANVDDLDPRLWPGVLAGLLAEGAADAWLVPILMKKGRPAHTLCVLAAPERVAGLRGFVFAHTSTLGIRESERRKVPLERHFVPVRLADGEIAVKVGSRDSVILQVMPEFEDVAAAARRAGRPERVILQEAMAAATAAGLVPGRPVPTVFSSGC